MFDYDISSDLSIFTDRIVYGSPQIPPVRRRHESLIFITDGCLLYENDNEQTIVKKGHIGYIGRGRIDKLSAYECDKVTFISTNFNYIDGPTDNLPSLPFNTLCSEGSPRYEALFLKVQNTFSMRLPAYLINAKSIMLEIIGRLYNENALSDIQIKKFNEIKKGVDYIKRNFDNPNLIISDIA